MIVNQARKSLIDFAIATDSEYQDTWFHESLAAVLEDSLEKVTRGEDVRIIIQTPPQVGKSEISTKKFPAWVLGKHPEYPVIVSSYSQDLATRFGQGTREIMTSPSYQKIFDAKLRSDTKAKAYWMTGEGGGYNAVGVGGAITGMNFKIGIIDDPFKNREEADSQTVRDSRWDWYRSTFYTRQKGNTAIIVINTRWHTDDLVGRLLEQQEKAEAEGEEHYDKWTLISYPAIAIEDELHRDKGDALWPERFPISKLRATEQSLGPYEFSALYQANPITSETQEFKEHWIKERSFAEVEALNTRKFVTIDPGGRNLENDATGIVRNYVDRENNWNIKAIGVRFDSSELINYIFKLHEEGFEAIGIEETVYLNAVEPFFKIECRKRNQFPKVVPLKHSGRNKEVRIRGLIPRYASGSIFHISGECSDLEKELFVFPKGAHDDVLDSLAYQLDIAEPPADYIKKRITEMDRKKRRTGVRKSYGL